MDNHEEKYEKAKLIAKGKVDFLRHLIVYVIVVLVLAAINNILDPGGYQWWLWPAVPWGFFLFLNLLSAYVFKWNNLKRLERKIAEKELEKMGREG